MSLSRDERLRRTLKRSEVFFPYFAAKSTFDDRRTRVALRSTGITCSPLRSYFDRLIEYALAADWGREQPGRDSAAAMRTPTSPSRAATVTAATGSLCLAPELVPAL
jgi:hypothetical protein